MQADLSNWTLTFNYNATAVTINSIDGGILQASEKSYALKPGCINTAPGVAVLLSARLTLGATEGSVSKPGADAVQFKGLGSAATASLAASNGSVPGGGRFGLTLELGYSARAADRLGQLVNGSSNGLRQTVADLLALSGLSLGGSTCSRYNSTALDNALCGGGADGSSATNTTEGAQAALGDSSSGCGVAFCCGEQLELPGDSATTVRQLLAPLQAANEPASGPVDSAAVDAPLSGPAAAPKPAPGNATAPAKAPVKTPAKSPPAKQPSPPPAPESAPAPEPAPASEPVPAAADAPADSPPQEPPPSPLPPAESPPPNQQPPEPPSSRPSKPSKPSSRRRRQPPPLKPPPDSTSPPPAPNAAGPNSRLPSSDKAPNPPQVGLDAIMVIMYHIRHWSHNNTVRSILKILAETLDADRRWCSSQRCPMRWHRILKRRSWTAPPGCHAAQRLASPLA